jgi:K+/H+ antiporter YhaU regulatory subunit KhtT
VVVSPDASFVLEHGDILVALGRADKIEKLGD